MMYPKRHLPDIEQWSQSSGSNVIPRWAWVLGGWAFSYERGPPVRSTLGAIDPLAMSGTFFFCTLVTGPKRSLSLKRSETRVYEPQIPTLGTARQRRCSWRGRAPSLLLSSLEWSDTQVYEP